MYPVQVAKASVVGRQGGCLQAYSSESFYVYYEVKAGYKLEGEMIHKVDFVCIPPHCMHKTLKISKVYYGTV